MAQILQSYSLPEQELDPGTSCLDSAVSWLFRQSLFFYQKTQTNTTKKQTTKGSQSSQLRKPEHEVMVTRLHSLNSLSVTTTDLQLFDKFAPA